MAIKFVVAHRMDLNNVGDLASNPLQYFLSRDEYEVVDVVEPEKYSYPDVPMIIGGGGLIGNDFMGDFWGSLLSSPDKLQLEEMWSRTWNVNDPQYKDLFFKFNESYQQLISTTLEKIKDVTAPRFIWGAGHNGAPETVFEKIRWPKSFSRFNLVGIRDSHESSRFPWVPCASCMHPALRKKYPIKNDVVFFEHKKQMIKDFGADSVPRFINSGSNIEQTIELLGSANIILTNSYHGVYWGTLLKKKVMIVGGHWSSKFKFFKHPPITLMKGESYRNYIDTATVYEDALDECIDTTESYWSRIKERV
jgi:hypothetical protein